MEKNEEFDFEAFKQETIKGLYAGKPLNGEKGIFAPLLKHFFPGHHGWGAGVPPAGRKGRRQA
jgi:hypothetical protein